MAVADHDTGVNDPPVEKLPRRSMLGHAVRWVQRDHLRRGPFPVMAGAVAATTIAHWADVPAIVGVPVTALATIGMYTREMNMPGERRPNRAGLATLAAGSWVTAATAWGLTAGPDGIPGLMAWLGLAAAGLTYWAYRKDPAIVQALAWQEQCREWRMRAASYGLSGSHLLDWRETRLGEAFTLDTRGTGRRASQLAASDIAEVIAEQETLPTTRVKVRAERIAGRIQVSIRYKDPWAEDLPHPLLDPTPEIALPEVADAREPRIIGMDPETANPLEVVLWDEEGAKRVLIVAATGSGKTVTVNDMLERETAADNSFPIGINVSKAKEMRRWRPALGASACGPQERQKAFYLLRMCRHIIDYRGSREDTDSATVEPTAETPLVPVYADEMDELLKHSDALGQAIREEVEYVSTKGRSEAVSWVLIGTRGTAAFTGGGTIRNMADQVILGRVARRSEMQHAAGDLGMVLPEMSAYGEGKAGVQLVAHVNSKRWETGRSFRLEKLTDIDRLANGRTPTPLEPGLMAYLNEQMGEDLVAALLSNEPFTPPSAKTPRRPSTPPATAARSAMSDAEDAAGRAAAARARATANLAATPQLDTSLTSGERRALAIQRRKKTAEQTTIPPEVRAMILRLVAEPEGASTRQIEAAMREEFGHERGTSKDSAWRYLDVLRFQQIAEVRGAGGGRRWHLTAPPSDNLDAGLAADVDQLMEQAEDDALDAATEHRE